MFICVSIDINVSVCAAVQHLPHIGSHVMMLVDADTNKYIYIFFYSVTIMKKNT